MSLPSLAVRRPVTTLVVLGAVAGLGILAVARMSVDFLPPLSVPRIVISVRMSEVDAGSVELQVTRPLEDWLSGIGGLRSLSSVSRRGELAITAAFHWGTDIEEAVREVRERVEKAMPLLPAGMERPAVLAFDPASDPIMMVGVTTGDGIDDLRQNLAHLRETAVSLVKKRLEQLDGVARVDVVGGVERLARIELDPIRMRALKVQPAAVAGMVADGGAIHPGGTVRTGGLRLALTIASGYQSLADVLAAPVARLPGGRQVRLGEIARGVDTIGARSTIARVNGREAVALLVRTDAGANTVFVSRRVRAELHSLEQESPRLRLPVLSDDAEFIERSIADVGLNMLVGVVLSIGVLMVSLRNLRDPLIAAVAIPISALAACLAIWCAGVQVNIISLAGLGMGIGMLGDNALVVIENARRLMDLGTPQRAAAIQAAEELQGPLTASTLTNAAIFLPVLAVPGVARELFADMAMTMTSALLASLGVSLTIVPLLLARGTPPALAAGEIAHAHGARAAPRWRSLQDAVVCWSVRHAAGVIGGSALVLIATAAAGMMIPTAFVPAIDQRRVVLTVGFPGPTPLDSVSEASIRIERLLAEHPSVATTASLIGGRGAMRRDGEARNTANIEITPSAGWPTDSVSAYARTVGTQLRRDWPSMQISLAPRRTGFEQTLRPFSSSVSVRLLGGSETQRQAAADSLLPRLRAVGGLVDLQSTTESLAPELRFVVDPVAAAVAGITPAEVVRQIGGYARERRAADLQSPDGPIPVNVAIRDQPHADVLMDLEIVAGGRGIPLRGLGRWERTITGDDRRRYNREGAAVLQGNAAGRPLTAVLGDVERHCRALQFPPEVRWELGGEFDEIRHSFTSLLLVLALSLISVFMILASQYESFRWPLVVLLISPLAATGTVAALMIAGEPYTVFSLVGVVIMIGAIDNDAVIVVDVAVSLRREGRSPVRALREAFKRRIRSILLTTATTVLGILPFLLGIGNGLELITSLSLPLAGGLIASTAATLLVLPAVYAVFDRRRGV
jgi:HAE1 family hydrophobic/amphiphilic exporter-1